MNFYLLLWPKLTCKLHLQCAEGGISDGRSEGIHHISPRGPLFRFYRPSTRHHFSDFPEDEAHVLNDRCSSRAGMNAQKHSPVVQHLVCTAYSYTWESGSSGCQPERDSFADKHLNLSSLLEVVCFSWHRQRAVKAFTGPTCTELNIVQTTKKVMFTDVEARS